MCYFDVCEEEKIESDSEKIGKALKRDGAHQYKQSSSIIV